MKLISALTITLSLFFSTAFASNEDIREIINLSNQVELAAQTTGASSDGLQEAKDKLREVLALLNQNAPDTGSGPNTECINYAYTKYLMSQSSATATNNAVEACRQIKDLPVASYLFDKYIVSMSSASAMDSAKVRAGKNMIGKLSILDFIFSKYIVSMSSSSAVTKAADNTALLPRDSRKCLEDLFSKYLGSMSSASAIDAAINGCKY